MVCAPLRQATAQGSLAPMVTLKTSSGNVKEHDNRHTFITNLAESGQAADETIEQLAGHVSKRMLKHYSTFVCRRSASRR